ncbi:MAG TPA: alpha/beta family hydrolase [Terriglobales bacterium]|nr:alpha/beta family hydrolase [Terriglobales bacterium]
MNGSRVEQFSDSSLDPAVRGFLHLPNGPVRDALILTHGAGGNCRGPLLTALAEAFSGEGFAVLRCDLPFRQARSFGPPRPGEAARDRQGLKNAVSVLRKMAPSRIFLGGQSYGGRQTTMLCADEPELVDGLLLLSYPLHAPGRPDQLRTQHLPKLGVPALFVHGTRDPFGSIEEMKVALKLIPGRTLLFQVEGEGHDLGFKGKKRNGELPGIVLAEFRKTFG